jgi:hypothetical protein
MIAACRQSKGAREVGSDEEVVAAQERKKMTVVEIIMETERAGRKYQGVVVQTRKPKLISC